MRLLATREHSSAELFRKLGQKGFAQADAQTLIAKLQQENLLSDCRFIECFIRSRQQRGYGPIRIQAELRQHGFDDEQIRLSLDAPAHGWLRLAQQVRQKKFGTVIPQDYQDKARQMRFLEYRGFSHEQIRRIIELADEIA
jgi:regulatory protein